MRYRGPTGAETTEVVVLDADRKVVRYSAHYAR